MIIGTAGHIDHGKTALVRALTGVDTDRLPEEKRRGITIALGFAPLTLPAIGVVGVVDVPGHQDFVRTMLAGASGVDCALLVIAADEGVMPQTREHVAILSLLGVSRAVVALTKSDLADADLRELVAIDVHELLRDTPLAGSALVPVSAHTGEGIDALRAALSASLANVPPRETDDLWRLPVDRVFSVAGAGTVVTGTAWSGALAPGETVRILPSDRTARVRGIESHGEPVTRSLPGARLAVSLVGVQREDIHPGDLLVRDGEPWHATRVLRADLSLLPTSPPLGVRSRVRVHVGTAECGGRIVPPSGTVLSPGVHTPTRIVLDAPLVLRAGDRLVLRGGSPHTTIGGGVVTDPLPITPRARPWPQLAAEPKDRLLWMLGEAGALGIDVAPLGVRLGLRAAALDRLLKNTKGTARVGERLVLSSVLDELRTQLVNDVAEAHRTAPLAPGLDRQTARGRLTPNNVLADEVIRRAERAGTIEIVGSALRIPGWNPAATHAAEGRTAQLRAVLEAAGAEPPSVAELQHAHGPDVPALLKLLLKEGSAIPVALDRWFAASAVQALLDTLRQSTEPTRRYSPSELREMLGITRKYLIPFLEWCDRRGISRRDADGRVFPSVPANP